MAKLKSFSKCTIKDFKKLHGGVGCIYDFFEDTPQIKNLEDILQLFNNVEVKDEEGVWHTLYYENNYEIIFGGEGITLIPFPTVSTNESNENVWPPVSKYLQLKEEYIIKDSINPELSDVGTFIKIPKNVTEYIFDDED